MSTVRLWPSSHWLSSQLVVRVVGEQGDVLLQGLPRADHVPKVLHELEVLAVVGVEVEQLQFVPVALAEIHLQGVGILAACQHQAQKPGQQRQTDGVLHGGPS